MFLKTILLPVSAFALALALAINLGSTASADLTPFQEPSPSPVPSASTHIECQFENKCTASGEVCVESTLQVCQNRLEVRCNNGFQLVDASAHVKQYNGVVAIRAVDPSVEASALLEIFGSSELRSALTIRSHLMKGPEKLIGRCNVN